MNIEIANRLVNLRKENGLSQEQLAEKIGVSRQAVSKWERSEASPDTDNIILLARLYNVSLDELLRTEDEIPVRTEASDEEYETGTAEKTASVEDDDNAIEENNEPFHLPEADIETAESVSESKEEPQPEASDNTANSDPQAVASSEKIQLKSAINKWWKDLNLHVGFDGIYTTDDMSGEEYKKWNGERSKFAIAAITVTIALLAVFTCLEPYNWLDYFLFSAPLPIIACSLESAVKSRNPARFAYPVLVLEIFMFILYVGYDQLSLMLWLTVPIYYWICRLIKKQALGTYFFPCAVIVIYIAAGLLADLWIYGLIIFLTIPLYNFIKKSFKLK